MKNKDIAKKNTKELHALLSEKQVALRDFRFSVSGSNARNVKEGKSIKRDIARVLTVLNAGKTEQGGSNLTKSSAKGVKTPKAN